MYLKAILREPHAISNVEARLSLEEECAFISKWLDKYRSAFEEALSGDKSLKASPLTTLCPVAVKTIELVFRHCVFGFGD